MESKYWITVSKYAPIDYIFNNLHLQQQHNVSKNKQLTINNILNNLHFSLNYGYLSTNHMTYCQNIYIDKIKEYIENNCIIITILSKHIIEYVNIK